MKRSVWMFLGLVLAVGAVRAADVHAPVATSPAGAPGKTNTDFSKVFKDDKERFSYAVGVKYGSAVLGDLKTKAPEFPVDMDAMAKGFKDALGNTPLLTDAQIRETMTDFGNALQQMQALRAQKARSEGEAFLAANKTKPGVVTLTNGLQYKVITEGTGAMPKLTDQVTVNYRGTLVDGTEFDSSYKRGTPATFKVGGVIKGWTQALQMMKAGSKWELYIPTELAYAEHPTTTLIPPGAALVFEVELISIQAPKPPPAPTPLTSDIIKVPSAEEMAKGAKIETIKAEDVAKEQAKQAALQTTNTNAIRK